MNEIYYESGNKEKIYLDKLPFWMQTGDFFDYEWLYNVKNNRILGFQKEIAEREFLITVFGCSEAEYAEHWSRIHDVFEKDIYEMTPGKLYFGEYYLNCYIFASEKTEWEYDCNMHDNLYRLVTDRPFWIRDFSLSLPVPPPPVLSGLTYDYTYDYTYGKSGLHVIFENDHYAESDFELTAYGPFSSLFFVIGANTYEVDVSCKTGERLILNTKAQTIVKIDAKGREINVYGDQNFDYDVFARIPPGISMISYRRTHPMDLVIYQERSEPKWGDSYPANALKTADGYYLLANSGKCIVASGGTT